MASIYDQPATIPPQGQTSNSVDPPNRYYIFIVMVTICVTLTTVMVATRIYVSAFVIRRFKWDDGLIFLCWISMITYSTVAIEFTKYGGYTDIWNVRVGDMIHPKRLAYIAQILYSIFFCMIKVAVLILYKRVFVPTRARRYWINFSILTVIFFNVLFYVANTLLRIFVCHPIERVWNSTVPGKCVDVNLVMIITSTINIISDVFILLLPIIVIRKLNMPRKRKAEILALFACGALCLIASVGRLALDVINFESPNPVMVLMDVAVWGFGELTSSFLASCVPMIPRLVHHFRNRGQPPGFKRSSAAPVMPGRRPEALPTSSPKKSNNKQLSPWSMISILRDTQVDEEDPYLIEEVTNIVGSDDTENRSETSVDESGILVTKKVDITSLPLVHVKEQDLNARYHLQPPSQSSLSH